ncbi:F0F1 ATP synthase subunit epsilon [Pseudothioclava nitratireducens]|jgi:F-type H+-transporting ATPase subunit epsilon|uniref:F0F1 ATP synthase subunit epsilon n=1 Tax=Pseudothioclava nitratireducens TaxID=1928646 RepID=UPI0023DA294A|nr:F0F1 ATP synthase subunit epsilon [Defluviimonas nitratireducens]MDF1621012.1 F0F1 ATP synthase subunit epsilon [Defluviimonas nitratireducens]
MADTMQFDLVSPERKLASAQVTEVRVPGADGDLTVMAGHAPLIATLRPGILVVVGPNGTEDYAVTGGFVQVDASGVTVLAERGLPKAELTAAIHAEMMAEAKKTVEEAHPSVADAATKMLADMEALGTHMSL